MIKNKLQKGLKSYVPLILVFFTLMIIARLGEFFLVTYNHSLSFALWQLELLGVVVDLQFTLLISIVFVVPYLLLYIIYKKGAFWFFTVSSIILLVGHLALVRYFSLTLTPLGTDLWAYTISEIFNTVQSSAGISFMFISLMLGLLIIAFVFFKKAQNLRVSGGSAIAFCLLLLLSVIISVMPYRLLKEVDHRVFADNKSHLFFADSFKLILNQDSKSSYSGSGYPLLHQSTYEEDVLGPYFNAQPKKPNLVFIIFEGLGKKFVGEDGDYRGFTPFVDSLARNGLYWPNFLSTTGRTFGLMPSLFGSLPLIERGFTSLGEDMPTHQSLIQLLNKKGYYTSYYSGFDTDFDNVSRFLNRQNIDYVLNKDEMDNHYNLSDLDTGEDNYWGFPDKVMFSHASGIIDTLQENPRLEIFHTLQTHSPFSVPKANKYELKFNQILDELSLNEKQKSDYRTYKSELTTFLYTDDALRQFFDRYRQRTSYKNTIFVITGDHRLIPIPMNSQMSRYHVPLIIYSPLLKKPVQFNAVSTLFDVTPSILAFLQKNYQLNFPERSHWLGTKIDTARWFRNIHSTPLMRNKNEIVDFLDQDYFLAEDQLYKLQDELHLKKIDNAEIKNKLQDKLLKYRQIARYVTQNDKLYDVDAGISPHLYQESINIDSLFAPIDSKGMSKAEQFQMARQMAFDNRYQASRAIAKRLLTSSPNYHDVRILLGRTYSWNRQYNKARNQFREVIRRDSTYYDSYNALFDVEYWSGHPQTALEVINQGLKYHPNYDSFLSKKANILIQLNRENEAEQVLQKLEKVAPENEDLNQLRSKINR